MNTTTPTEPRDEVALAQIDQRYAALRLVEPDDLSRIRSSIDRMGILSPVLVALPFKLMLFVLADGWNLLLGSLAASFVT